eukprot:m.140710 g.140710  ORF g.140710 m.140710 type:complete len:358 (-) comp30134_c0_seq1:269-1342(-)
MLPLYRADGKLRDNKYSKRVKLLSVFLAIGVVYTVVQALTWEFAGFNVKYEIPADDPSPLEDGQQHVQIADGHNGDWDVMIEKKRPVSHDPYEVAENPKPDVEGLAQLEIERLSRGVNLTVKQRYVATGKYTCPTSLEVIARDAVNDNYCDCVDGSDEPGTSACSHLGTFFCQNRGHTSKSIPSYRVNDGVGDCCDSSDEWDGTPRRHIAKDCTELAKESRTLRAAHDEGKRRRSEYVALGKQHGSHDETAFGPDLAFFPLTKGCYDSALGGYHYNLCFFSKVEQREGKNTHNLGRNWRWLTAGKLGVFAGGTKCWNGPARETRVTFACGMTDTITAMSEVQKCVYAMTFETPAACV